jgi:tetratricopeptide (TPR) repeat protein
MEIRILSAGKEFGPYSESQVRQYLSEGLISAADPAMGDGMTEWMPAGDLLAQLPQPETAAVPQTEASSDAEPRAIRVRTTAIPRAKRGPIVLQAPFSEGDAPRRRSGKTALTIEPPRPTTQLPPVAKFVPREERRPGRGSVDTDRLAPGHFFEQTSAEATLEGPTTTPEPVSELPPDEPPLAPAPDVPPREPAGDEPPDLHNAIWYASLIVGLIGLGLVAAAALLIWHFNAPAQHGAPPSAARSGSSANIAVPRTPADYSARGLARQQKGDLDGALADYDKAIALDPRNLDTLARRALTKRDKGDWDGALADYNALLALAPDNADAYSNRGYVKQTKGDLDGALADYTEALTRDPTIAKAYYNVGLIKVQRGDIDGGIEAYNKALDLDPKLARAYYNRGSAKNLENNLDGAIADYTQAIDLDPTNAMAFDKRGLARQAKGDSDGALADFSQALAIDPSLAPAYGSRGEIEVQRGDFNAAVADCTRAIELDPKEQAAFYNRGLAALGLRDLDHAGGDFSKYCDVAPHGPNCDTARLFLWVVGAQQNSRDKADDDLNYAVLNTWNSSPEDLTSRIADFLLGHIREDELITATTGLDPSLEPTPFCRVWYFAGVKRQVTGDTAAALACFQKAIATGQKQCCEYLFAKAQMVSLDQTRQASSQAVPAQ